MSRYSNEQQDILAKIRETLLRIDAMLADKSHDQVSDDAQIQKGAEFDETSPEERVERWTRTANEWEERFARKRAARVRNVQISRASTAAMHEQRIAKVETQLLRVVRAMGQVTEDVEAELRDLRQEGAGADARLAHFEAELAEALLQISRLCETVATDCRSILDLLPLLQTDRERPTGQQGQ